MIKEGYYEFVENHNLANRIYDMMFRFYAFKNSKCKKQFTVYEIHDSIREQLKTLVGIESYAKYLDEKLNENQDDISLACSLADLIAELDDLKDYVGE